MSFVSLSPRTTTAATPTFWSVPDQKKAPDINDSTVVQCTGAEHSTVHPIDMMDNAPYSQHLEDEEHDDVQDASGRGARQGKVYEGGEVGRSAKKDEGVGRNGDVYKGGGSGAEC